MRAAQRGLGGRDRRAVPPPLAGGAPRGLAGRPRRGGRRGHRAGGVPVRAARARPLRPPPPARPVAAPDRRQPRDRLVARPRAASRDRRRRAARARRAGRRDRRSATRSSPRSRTSAPSTARSSSCATCSATRPARSRRCSTSRAAPSTPGCAARSTRSPSRWRSEPMTRDELERALREAEVPDAVAARERARRTVLAAHAERRAAARAPRARWCGSRSPPRSRRSSSPRATLARAQALERHLGRSSAAPRRPRRRRPAGSSSPRAAAARHRGRRALARRAQRQAPSLGRVARTRPGRRRASSSASRRAARSPRSSPTTATCAGGCAARAGPLPALGARTALHIAYRVGRRRCGSSTATAPTTCWRAATWPPVAPAWRPSDPHTIAWAAATARSRSRTRTPRRCCGRSGPGPWSGSWRGRPTAAAARRRAGAAYTIHDVATGAQQRDARCRAGRRSWPPRSRRAARAGGRGVRRGRDRGPRRRRGRVLSAPGRLRDLVWSPDGRSAARGVAGRGPLAGRARAASDVVGGAAPLRLARRACAGWRDATP